ncbi:MAG: DUF721 domain-containing protein [Candidatus Nanopelagicaceae bacterium]
MKRDLAKELFRAFKSSHPQKKHRPQKSDNPSHLSPGSDPLPLKQVLDDLIEGRQWNQLLAEGNLFALWAEIVGDEVAEHSEPITLLDGRLTIRASSTAWATQLTLLTPSLLEKITKTAPGVLVDELLVLGPTPPSWRRGLRTIKGSKGPRDTYG